MKYVFLSLFTVFICQSAIAQPMSKGEIFSHYTKNAPWENNNSIDSLNKLIGDEALQNDLKMILERLNKRTDTLGFFYVSDGNIGVLSSDSCKQASYPHEAYLFWEIHGKTYVQRIASGCSWLPKEVSNTIFFNFAENNKNDLSREYIMPPILKAEKLNGKVNYSMAFSSHDILYVIYCKIGKFSKVSQISESDINTQESLFYEDNLRTKTYKWLLQVKEYVKR